MDSTAKGSKWSLCSAKLLPSIFFSSSRVWRRMRCVHVWQGERRGEEGNFLFRKRSMPFITVDGHYEQ